MSITRCSNQPGKHILVVDDEPLLCQLLCEILESNGFEAKQAKDGLEALDLWHDYQNTEHCFDLLIVDLKMPRMGGEELIKELRKVDIDIPIIVLTGHGDYTDAFVLLDKYHIFDFINKPIIQSARVVFAVKNALEKGQLYCKIKQLNNELEFLAKKRLADYQTVQKESYTDYLTGTRNRRYLMDVANNEFHRAKRHKHSISLIMYDLDHFKTFNDNYGHEKGDIVLSTTCHYFQSMIRDIDTFVRLGGEEFLILLPETEITKAITIAERLRECIEKRSLEAPINNTVTASFGVVEVDLEQSLQSNLKRVDRAMYIAKKSGRNCVKYN